jgi:hypothetical protein
VSLSFPSEHLQELSKRERKLIKAHQLHFQHRGNHIQKKVAVVDAIDVDVIRRLIRNFHVTQKQQPTLNTVVSLIR